MQTTLNPTSKAILQSTQTVAYAAGRATARAGKVIATSAREMSAAPFQLAGVITGFAVKSFMEGYRYGSQEPEQLTQPANSGSDIGEL